MDILAIDVGTECVDLCKWDGQQLSACKLPTQAPLDAWKSWINVLCPTENYQILYRCTHGEYAATSRADDIAACAKRQGARWVRLFPEDIAADPSIAAARYEAARHRLGSVCSVEVGAGHATLAVLGARGALLSYDRILLHDASDRAATQLTHALGDLISSARDFTAPAAVHHQSDSHSLTGLPLIVAGGRGSTLAMKVAEACDAHHVLIPERSAYWATIGMYHADIVLSFCEDRPPSPLCLPELRRAFGRLMDRACTAITMEGYDLDDAVSGRTIGMSYQGESRWVEVPCAGLSDESAILDVFRAQHSALVGSSDSTRPVEVRSIGLRVVIETKKPQLPPFPAPAGPLENALMRQPPTKGSMSANVRHYVRDKFPIGVEIRGPACLWEADESMMIPARWVAERLGAGGMWISKRDHGSTSE